MFIAVDLVGSIRSVRKCTEDDVLPHFEKISKYIPDWEKDTHIERMYDCVDDGTSYMVEGTDCFLYYKKINKSTAVGVALNGVGYPLIALSLFKCIFEEANPEVITVRFGLHEGKNVSEYKSIVTMSSIRNYDPENGYLAVRVDKLLKKFHRMDSDQRKIRWAR